MKRLNIAMTNVAGLGAIQLTTSLIPALEAVPGLSIGRIYLPDRGPLSAYCRLSPGPVPLATVRRLPNALSRLVECTVGGARFSSAATLLVLGDVPLRTTAPQILFVQTPHILAGLSTAVGLDGVKFRIMRAIFRANAPRVAAFIVQSEVMRDALVKEYRIDPSRVMIVQQPPPEWLRTAPKPPRQARTVGAPLCLFYPAAEYPHKNHKLLNRLALQDWSAVVARLTLTIDKFGDRDDELGLDLVGRLGPAEMLQCYESSDALLFLSTAESYGFPLVEAMWLGLPIVVADRPYARALCGDQALYFDEFDPRKLIDALCDLKGRLDQGWRPDWRDRLAELPKDWTAVADAIAAIAAIAIATPNTNDREV